MKKSTLMLILLVIIAGLLYLRSKNNLPKDGKVADANLCFSFVQNKDNGLSDRYYLKLNIKDGNAVGDLSFLPSEKDSKTGPIEGDVIKPSEDMPASRANLWWTATAEGLTAKEELKIIFGNGTAAVGLGDMVEGGDGVYKYKSIPEIVYGLVLYETPCENLN